CRQRLAGGAGGPDGQGAQGGRGGPGGQGRALLGDPKSWIEFGVVPYKVPCFSSKPYVPSPAQLTDLRLAPQDGTAIQEAYTRSNARLLARLTPACAAAFDPAMIGKIGPVACFHAILDNETKEGERARKLMTTVAAAYGATQPPPE